MKTHRRVSQDARAFPARAVHSGRVRMNKPAAAFGYGMFTKIALGRVATLPTHPLPLRAADEHARFLLSADASTKTLSNLFGRRLSSPAGGGHFRMNALPAASSVGRFHNNALKAASGGGANSPAAASGCGRNRMNVLTFLRSAVASKRICPCPLRVVSASTRTRSRPVERRPLPQETAHIRAGRRRAPRFPPARA